MVVRTSDSGSDPRIPWRREDGISLGEHRRRCGGARLRAIFAPVRAATPQTIARKRAATCRAAAFFNALSEGVEKSPVMLRPHTNAGRWVERTMNRLRVAASVPACRALGVRSREAGRHGGLPLRRAAGLIARAFISCAAKNPLGAARRFQACEPPAGFFAAPRMTIRGGRRPLRDLSELGDAHGAVTLRAEPIT
jgi:hypothetical protein